MRIHAPQCACQYGGQRTPPTCSLKLSIVHYQQHRSVDIRRRRVWAQAEPLHPASIPLSNTNPKHTETGLVLDQAHSDLMELCKEESSVECWKALDYFITKRQQYEQHCDLEHEIGEHDAAACTALNAFEKFVREQMGTGSVMHLRDNLLIMQRTEARRATRGEAPQVQAALSDREVKERVALIRLFRALDTDGDGRLSMLDLQDGLQARGAALTDTDVAQIASALDVTPASADILDTHLDIDGFMDLMDALPVLREACAAGHDDTAFIRHAGQMHGWQHPGGVQGPHLSGYTE